MDGGLEQIQKYKGGLTSQILLLKSIKKESGSHIQRMSEIRTVKKVFIGKLEGRRRGRPRKR
ncbi:hypothetical protein C0J52_18591 [Blattella germanica]|nr:hypothetical protein C0J52_18591 [Blattella germanica]